MPELSRRRLMLAGCAAAAGWMGCSSSSSVAPIEGDVPAGNVADLAVGTLRVVSGQPVCIGRDTQGVYAMTLICTHEGCDMATEGSVSAQGIHCDCHGSVFDANGSVVQGPANSPLVHYLVTADTAGELTIHGASTVDSSTRLAVS